MKTLKFLTIAALAFSISACSSEETSEGGEGGSTDSHEEKTSSESNLKNEITTLKYGGSDQSFDQMYAYANYNKTFLSYRVMYLNYDKSEDSDYGQRTGEQVKIVVFMHNPSDGEFKPGKYTPNGDENGMNKGFAQIENSDGTMMINTNVDDPGYIDVIEVSEDKIVGEYHLKGTVISDGTDFEISGTFNAKNE